ncbi:MAG TPA: helix-turn-helix domain-containing protein [Sporichthyaceae bacterium]|jgi:excisionase family DNA binding protein|nr:helix-turn-helix domain-containing protein [Sporichthyaceae bacterium]
MTRETTVLPSQDSTHLDAAETLLRRGPVSLSLGEESVPLPLELQELLTVVVRAMRRGQGVTLAPVGQQLTTQQAADLLGISRPTLVKLLDEGRLPFETPGRHRRLRLNDVLLYQQQRSSQRRELLRELASDAQELGAYDTSPEQVEAALADARAKLA